MALTLQSGSYVWASGAQNATVTINSVVTSRTFVFAQAATDAASNNQGSRELFRYRLASNTSIEFEFGENPGNDKVEITWWVLEFGPADGVSVQHGGATMTGASPTDVTISSVNTAKSFPLISSRRNNGGVDYLPEMYVGAEITSATNLRLHRAAVTNDTPVWWQVITLPSSATIQKGSTSWTDGVATQSITSVDLTKAWLVCSYTSADPGARARRSAIRSMFNSATQLGFSRGDGTGTMTQNVTVYWNVIEWNALSVQHKTGTFASGDATLDLSLSAIDPRKTVPFGGYWASPYGRVNVDTTGHQDQVNSKAAFTSKTNLRLTRRVTGTAADVSVEVVSFNFPYVTFDAGSSAEHAGATSLTFAHTCSGLERALYVYVSTFQEGGAAAPSGVTYGGVALTSLGSVVFGVAGNERLSIWRLVNPATGSNNIVITMPSQQEIVAAAASFNGVDRVAPDSGSASFVGGSSETTSVSQNISSAAGDLVLDGIAMFNPSSLVAGEGQIERVANDNGTSVESIRLSTEPGAPTTTMSWTFGSRTRAHGVINIKAAEIRRMQVRSATSASTSSLQAAFHPAPSENNLLIAICMTDNDRTHSISGWTAGPSALATGGSKATMFWKVAEAFEAATVPFTIGGGADLAQMYIIEVFGVQQLEDSDSVNSGGTAVTSLALPAVDAAGRAYVIGGMSKAGTDGGNNTWGNDFGEIATSLGRLSAAQRIVTSGSYGSNHGWGSSVRAAGVIASFKAGSGGAPAENVEVVATGGGTISVVGKAGKQVSTALTGGGTASVVGVANRHVSVSLSGGGQASVSETTDRNVTAVVTGGGRVKLSRLLGRVSVVLTGGGAASVVASTERHVSVSLNGGGAASAEAHKEVSSAVQVDGGGTVEVSTLTLQTYEYVGSGGLQFGGAADVSRELAFVGTGGIQFGGAALVSRELVYDGSGGIIFAGEAVVQFTGVSTYSYVGSGGLQLGGTALVSRELVFVGTGGITFAGAAEATRDRDYVGSGGLTLAGSALISRDLTYEGSGGIQFAGSAEVSRDWVFTASGGIVFSGEAGVQFTGVNTYSYTGTGGLAFAGAALVSRDRDFVGAGGLVFSGSADTEFVGVSTYSYTGTGGIQYGGSGAVSRDRAFVGSGGIQYAGAALESRDFAFEGAGTLVFGGEATTSFTVGTVTYEYVGAGGIVFGGSAGVAVEKAFIGAGGITFGGAATIIFQPTFNTYVYTGTGGVLFGGGAVFEHVPFIIVWDGFGDTTGADVVGSVSGKEATGYTSSGGSINGRSI